MTITNKNYKRSQKGRSMVEMLGVLAIVGVLSAGGVYGYGVAMKKHKANELLHQASMLASSIAAQIASGKIDLALENFSNSSYGTFSEIAQPNDEQFTMQITGMDSAVCEQMEKMSGGMVREAKCDGTTLTLTYNNNLTSDKVAADYNGKPDECVASGRKYCDNDTCISSTKECPTGGSGEGSPDSCNADIVNVYNCETKTTSPCCPDNGNSCEQPQCSCDDNNDCPGQQICQDKTCVCPEGGTLALDGVTCCERGWAWNGGSYNAINVQACDCPEGATLSSDGTTCCAMGHNLEGYIVDVAQCGCPYDDYNEQYGKPSTTNPEICCLNGYEWAENTYLGFNFEACGCPEDGAESKTVSGVCCKGGYAWGFDRYNEENIEACGCPTDSEGNTGTPSTKISGVCCLGAYAWSGDPMFSYTGEYFEACGCPTDEYGNTGTLSMTNSDICCFDAHSWDGVGYNTKNIADCGCPADSEGNKPSTTDSGQCCRNGLAYGGSDYDRFDFAACGCPYDFTHNQYGTPSDTVSGVCCDGDGLTWVNGNGYNDPNIEACGCPMGGKKSETVSGVCCYNGYAWSGSVLYTTANIEACGCPYDYQNERPGTPSEVDPRVCCSGALQWVEQYEMYYNDFSPYCS